jgi:hypothetical protein
VLRLILILLPLVLPTYVVRFKVGSLPTTLLEIFVFLFLAVWTYQRGIKGWKNGCAQLCSQKWLWPLAAWLVVGALGIFIAPDHLAALGLWRAYFLEPILIFVLLADLIKTDGDKRLLIRSLIFINIFVALWAAFQFFTGLGIPSPWNALPAGIRATGPFPYPNALALFAVPISALCFYLAMQCQTIRYSKFACLAGRQDIRNSILWLGFLSGLAATLLAKSDGGLIALIAAVLITLILKRRTRLPAIIIAILIGILLCSIPVVRNTVSQKIFFKDWSGQVRLVMWQETAAMLKNRPIFGAGLGAYPDVIQPYHQATWMEIFQYPHNILLNLWSEVGLLGILAFTWLLVLWIKRGGLIALPILAALLIQGLVDVPYFKNDLAILFWILMAVTLSAHKITAGEYPRCDHQSK